MLRAEVKKFEGFTKLLKENSFVKSSVTIVYLKPNAYQQYDEVRSQEAYILDHYEKNENENINLITGSHVYEDGKIEETRDTLVKRFQNWGKWGD